MLDYPIADNHLEKLFKKISDSQYAVALSLELPLHSVLTLHKSKGLEFEQIIIFFEDYKIFNKPIDMRNHYVACTRAKSKLIIIDTNHADSAAVKVKLNELFANVDCREFISKYSTSDS